ncbi:hypothetical protein PV325_011526, partial [Microctonus aethiopoides]
AYGAAGIKPALAAATRAKRALYMTLPGYRNERVNRKYIQQDIGGIHKCLPKGSEKEHPAKFKSGVVVGKSARRLLEDSWRGSGDSESQQSIKARAESTNNITKPSRSYFESTQQWHS